MWGVFCWEGAADWLRDNDRSDVGVPSSTATVVGLPAVGVAEL